MHSSYSLHIPNREKPVERRRKRRSVVKFVNQHQSYKYKCISCQSDVYFSPGYELVCSNCASRTVEKISETQEKRIISAR